MHLLGKVLAVFVLSLGLMIPAQADYPERPITIVAPYGPGGSSDILGRVLADMPFAIVPGRWPAHF